MIMQVMKRGAEAVLFLDKQDSEDVVIKERIKKGYRIAEIDSKLRKQRTKGEAFLISSARRAGLSTPKILSVDETGFKIIMEFIPGKRLKELLNETDNKTREMIAEELGKNVALLHSNKIVHGDLTTSNMIFHDNKIYFIDFGLGFFSQRIEDYAMDLAVLEEAIKSTHYKYLNELWQNILKGYSTADISKEVLKRLEEIEKRGRYVKR